MIRMPSPSAPQTMDADDSQESHEALLARADVQEAITRLEDLMSGRVKGLTEEKFQAALHERILSRRVS